MLSPSYTLSHHILTTHLEQNPIFSPISHTGGLRLREMKLLVQAAQPVTGGGDSNSAGPDLEPGYDHQHFNTILISTRIQTQLDYLFYQLKPGTNTRSELTIPHSVPWAVS